MENNTNWLWLEQKTMYWKFKLEKCETGEALDFIFGLPTFVKLSTCLLSGWSSVNLMATNQVKQKKSDVIELWFWQSCARRATFFYLKGFSLDFEEISRCSQDGEKLSGLYTQINIYQQRKSRFRENNEKFQPQCAITKGWGRRGGGGRARARALLLERAGAGARPPCVIIISILKIRNVWRGWQANRRRERSNKGAIRLVVCAHRPLHCGVGCARGLQGWWRSAPEHTRQGAKGVSYIGVLFSSRRHRRDGESESFNSNQPASQRESAVWKILCVPHVGRALYVNCLATGTCMLFLSGTLEFCIHSRLDSAVVYATH